MSAPVASNPNLLIAGQGCSKSTTNKNLPRGSLVFCPAIHPSILHRLSGSGRRFCLVYEITPCVFPLPPRIPSILVRKLWDLKSTGILREWEGEYFRSFMLFCGTNQTFVVSFADSHTTPAQFNFGSGIQVDKKDLHKKWRSSLRRSRAITNAKRQRKRQQFF